MTYYLDMPLIKDVFSAIVATEIYVPDNEEILEQYCLRHGLKKLTEEEESNLMQ